MSILPSPPLPPLTPEPAYALHSAPRSLDSNMRTILSSSWRVLEQVSSQVFILRGWQEEGPFPIQLYVGRYGESLLPLSHLSWLPVYMKSKLAEFKEKFPDLTHKER